MTNLDDLIERVGKASGDPDWELDRDIGLAIGGWELKLAEGYENFGPMLHTHDGVYMNAEGAPFPSFIESLDASIALCERVLPGTCWLARAASHRFGAIAEVWGKSGNVRAEAKTPPLALLLALLRALRSTQEGEGGQ